MKTLSLLIFLPFLLLAYGIKDNFPDKVRQIPQIGIELKPDKKAALEKDVSLFSIPLFRHRINTQ